VDRAVEEHAARHAEATAEVIERARRVLVGGNAAIASHLLGVSAEDIQRIAGPSGGNGLAQSQADLLPPPDVARQRAESARTA
jgi:hypothetical protein